MTQTSQHVKYFYKVDLMTFRDSIKHEFNVLSFSIKTLRVLLFVSLAGNSFSNSIKCARVILLVYSLKCAQEKEENTQTTVRYSVSC